MKKYLALIISLAFILSVGQTVKVHAETEVLVKTEIITHLGKKIEVVRTADNFIILYDSSSSMGESYEGGPMKMIEAEKQIIKEHMARLPELSWNAGLYSHTPGAFTFSMDETYYAMKPYNKAEFAEAIDRLPTRPSGPTMLISALKKLDKAMETIEGKTVVFLFSDGSYTRSGNQTTPLELAQEMARKHDICFYVISSAKGETQERLLEAVASINACSRVVSFEDLLGRPEYTTGALYVVEERLIPTFEVRSEVLAIKPDNILFDYDRSEIKTEFYPELNKLGAFLEKNPEAYTVLAGFTDNRGDKTYNMGLSRKRAESVAGYLYDRFNVDAGQVVLLWYGDADPEGSNNTDKGRSQNRRVECIIAGLN